MQTSGGQRRETAKSYLELVIVWHIHRDGASRLLRMRSQTLMVRSAAPPRVSNHVAPMSQRASGALP